MQKTVTTLLFMALFSSCEKPLSSMKEMKETTKEMKEITKEMNQKMDQTNKKMDETNQNTSNLGAASRHGFSEDKRNNKRKVLFSNTAQLDMGNTLTDAKIFLLAFEYQIWDGVADKEGLQERERLIADAISELHQSLNGTYERLKAKKKYLGLIKGDSKLEEMTPLELDDLDKQDERSFYAIATTLHVIDLLQERNIDQNKAQGLKLAPISLYDVITNALAKEKTGAPLTVAEQAVLVKDAKEMFIDLLKARMDFLSALALKNMVDEEAMGIKDQAQGLLFKLTEGSFGQLKLDSEFNEVNSITRKDIIYKLQGAVVVRDFLKSITGEAPRLNKDLASIYMNLSFDDGELVEIPTSEKMAKSLGEKNQDLRQWDNLRQRLLK
ncbi:MAG: hypothetical protein KC478_15855 [Bacteriovoracaceae bacterium]|nr:hypothetical protein [Bacteriovoracaceae bacterium]